MRIAIALLTAALVLVPFSPTLRAAGDAEEGVMTVTSFDGTAIDILVCKPSGASASDPAPVVLQSHGWGGSRWADCGSAAGWLAQGWGTVSISQRGFGDSGGEAHVHDPLYEGRDMVAVIDRIATFSWVQLEAPNDPVLAAIGGSYGGGYQFMTAFVETAATGSTRLDALAPEITWFDLSESLAPSGVVRTEWVAALYAVGAKDVHAGIHNAFAVGVATGEWPDGSVPGSYDIDGDFHDNGPVAWVENGVLLDVPVLIGQGTSDNLFNLNQGLENFERSLTPAARAQSHFIGYNGGHALPAFAPPGIGGIGVGTNTDPCSEPFGGFGVLSRNFFDNVLRGASHPMPSTPYSIATVEGVCLALASLPAPTTIPIGDVVTNTGAGAPQHIALATGPLTVAGVGEVRARLTSLGLDQRVFFGLSKGTTPLDARILENNMMPLRAVDPAVGADVTIELAGVASTLATGETLYLTVSPVSDMSAGHVSRAPGVVLLEDVEVGLPLY